MAAALDFAALMREERAKAKKKGASSVDVRENVVAPSSLLAPRSTLSLAAYEIGATLGIDSVHYIPDFVSPDEAAKLIAAVNRLTGWVSLPGRRLLNCGGVPHASGMFPECLPDVAQAVADALVQAGIFDAEVAPDQFLINEYRKGQGIEPHCDGPLYRPRAAILSLASPACLDFYANAAVASQTVGATSVAVHDAELTVVPRSVVSLERTDAGLTVAKAATADDVATGPAEAPVTGGSEKHGGSSGSGSGVAAWRRIASVALEPNSLLVFSGPAYSELKHGIQSRSSDDFDDLCLNAAGHAAGSWKRGEQRLSFTVRKACSTVEPLATAEGAAEASRRWRHWMRAVADGGSAKF